MDKELIGLYVRILEEGFKVDYIDNYNNKYVIWLLGKDGFPDYYAVALEQVKGK